MKYKIMLFDADGVTLKQEKYFSEYLAEQGVITSLEKTTPFFKGVFQECLVGKADLKQELAKVMEDWGWEGTVDELIAFWFSVGDDLDEKVDSYIQKAKERGIKCYLTTDQEKYRGEYLRQKFNNIFDGFFISNEIGYVKKDPEYFKFVLTQLKGLFENPSDVLFVDDGEHNIENAKSFGIKTVLFRTFADLPKLTC